MVLAIAVLAFVALAVFTLYRWQQRRRVRRVQKWVRAYLLKRFGVVPDPLSINCSDDPLWPVLVAFNAPDTGVHERLRFSCPARDSTFSLETATGVKH